MIYIIDSPKKFSCMTQHKNLYKKYFPHKKKSSLSDWKLFSILLFISLSGLLFIKFYYGFEWKELASLSFYENMANPSVRIVKIKEGLRKEEIAQLFGDKLGWGTKEESQFINAHLALYVDNLEGRYFPKTYMVQVSENPVEVSKTMINEYTKQTNKIKKPKTTLVINEDTILKIASLIQREAGKNDMRLISGIIWNRLFNGMKLQIDATLQYAKGNEEDGWWQQVEPEDKQIESPYNTYLYNSLPPGPIANPGIAAIEAAYNPQKTSCLFYLHDKKSKIHCSATYEEHKRNIDKYY